MKYQIVRNAAGEVVCFGPDDGMYEPTLKAGEKLSVQDRLPEPSAKDVADDRKVDDARASAIGKLKAFGLTSDELRALGFLTADV